MPAVIEVEGLRKEYRRLRGSKVVAVDGLDFSVPEGGVFGFLGPNGSGKTTTIRCRVLGAEVPDGLHNVMGGIGSIVETPTFFPTFSGRRNLLLLGAVDGIGPAAVDAALARVGLAERAGDLVKTYSLGMKQRLGIATALLKDPALLVLDEPANGLDPAGIREVRDLLRNLSAEGRTVFLSSHILSEVQQTCDRVAILSRGRCITQGAVEEVLSASREAAGLVVKVDDLDAGAAALSAAGLAATVRGDHINVVLPAERAAEVSETLAQKKLWVTELRPQEVSLEDVFLELTGDAPPS
jgi:ABC-2 type transport system ATP-binding protein